MGGLGKTMRYPAYHEATLGLYGRLLRRC